ncbi:hypothetical protein BKA57DRAFT_27951 [Linnemannia elongata]|nr:hypothetical protein BKA57DRAFT_27951 [Linnemannia elongata]
MRSLWSLVPFPLPFLSSPLLLFWFFFSPFLCSSRSNSLFSLSLTLSLSLCIHVAHSLLSTPLIHHPQTQSFSPSFINSSTTTTITLHSPLFPSTPHSPHTPHDTLTHPVILSPPTPAFFFAGHTHT